MQSNEKRLPEPVRSGASPIPGFVLLQKILQSNQIAVFQISRRSGYMHHANYTLHIPVFIAIT